MRGKSLLLVPIWLLLLCCTSFAWTVDLEGEVETAFKESRAVVSVMTEKVVGGASVQADLVRLKELVDTVRVSHLLLQERFRQRSAELEGNLLVRQQAMEGRYLANVTEFLSLIDALPPVQEISTSDLQPI